MTESWYTSRTFIQTTKSERNEVKKLITAIERHLKEQNGGKGNE